ncbi:MAG: hypothetical protein AVDCRST_MAG18-2862, partial [uncultured Thermomicrobiales bacterium]
DIRGHGRARGQRGDALRDAVLGQPPSRPLSPESRQDRREGGPTPGPPADDHRPEERATAHLAAGLYPRWGASGRRRLGRWRAEAPGLVRESARGPARDRPIGRRVGRDARRDRHGAGARATVGPTDRRLPRLRRVSAEDQPRDSGRGPHRGDNGTI